MAQSKNFKENKKKFPLNLKNLKEKMEKEILLTNKQTLARLSEGKALLSSEGEPSAHSEGKTSSFSEGEALPRS